MINKKEKERILSQLDKKDPVVILTHVNPDGDAIGSSLALAIFLRKQQIPVDVIIQNEVPDFLKWLPGFEMVTVASASREKSISLVEKAATLFMLDFNDSDRLAGLEDTVMKAEAFKILVDHHQHPSKIADIIVSEPWRGSSGEMIYLLIKDFDGASYMDKDIATCLYVAIITDTGNFRHGSSYSEVFEIAGELMNYGIEKDEIFSNVYDSYSLDRMKLLGYAMSEKMVLFADGKVAHISLTREEMKRFNYKVGDTEGFVNIPFSVSGVKVTAFFTEKPNLVKASFRSKGQFSVDKLASEHFNGGGHINAAGGEIYTTLEETIKKFEQLMEEVKDEL